LEAAMSEQTHEQAVFNLLRWCLSDWHGDGDGRLQAKEVEAVRAAHSRALAAATEEMRRECDEARDENARLRAAILTICGGVRQTPGQVMKQITVEGEDFLRAALKEPSRD
jgi:predicted phage gp36 major capsid-like protein